MLLSKGTITKQSITVKARDIFNAQGIFVTLDVIARQMNITKSRITNHFPTKDLLFLAIQEQYEQELAAAIGLLYLNGFDANLQGYVQGLSGIMDLQYQYRCVIIYLNVTCPGDSELKVQMRQNAERNKQSIYQRFQHMQAKGIISSQLLEPDQWQVFMFAYLNTLTQWVVHMDMYDNDKDLATNKRVYLKAIIQHLLGPYLSHEGRRQADALVYP